VEPPPEVLADRLASMAVAALEIMTAAFAVVDSAAAASAATRIVIFVCCFMVFYSGFRVLSLELMNGGMRFTAPN
jgi:hypothetical protein